MLSDIDRQMRDIDAAAGREERIGGKTFQTWRKLGALKWVEWNPFFLKYFYALIFRPCECIWSKFFTVVIKVRILR